MLSKPKIPLNIADNYRLCVRDEGSVYGCYILLFLLGLNIARNIISIYTYILK